MKLVTYLYRGQVSIGKVEGTQVVDLPASDPALPRTMLELIAAGPAALARARRIEANGAVCTPLAAAQLLAPIPNPSKFLAIGMNYAKHVEEAKAAGIPVPDTQVWFNKQVSCINAPYGEVHLPRVSDKLDYEVELGVVIGKRCRHVKAADARSVIFGYLVCNDVSVRDWQMRSATMTMGKSFDTTGPIGPWIVTDDEVADPHALSMRLFVNGELRQEEGTGGMVYNVFQQIEHLSTAFTLEPGDLLATGTPSGVGVAKKPPQFLKAGDVVRAEIGGIGHIENRIVPEPVVIMAGLKVRDLAFVRFRAPDLDEMARFGADFGFEPAQRDAKGLYQRGTGPQPYVHVTHEGPPAFLGVAFDAGSVEALQGFAAAHGLPVQPLDGPGGGQVVKLTDPDGFGVELIAGFAPVAPLALPEREASNVLDRYARRNTVKRIGQGPSTVIRLGHCVLNVTDFRRSEAWYKERFGFITSDEVRLPDGTAAGAFMRCDRGAQPSDHHAMFLFGLAPRGFNHAAFEVADIDDVMRGHDHLLRQGRKQDWGVGRHILGSQVFDYWLDPWGHGVEHWTDGDQMDAAWGSRTAPIQDLLGIQWGQAFPGEVPPLPGAAP